MPHARHNPRTKTKHIINKPHPFVKGKLKRTDYRSKSPLACGMGFAGAAAAAPANDELRMTNYKLSLGASAPKTPAVPAQPHPIVVGGMFSRPQEARLCAALAGGMLPRTTGWQPVSPGAHFVTGRRPVSCPAKRGFVSVGSGGDAVHRKGKGWRRPCLHGAAQSPAREAAKAARRDGGFRGRA